jgi:hypothetical protein
MDMTTSPGYPWTQQWSTKKQFLKDSKVVGVLKDYWDLIGTDNPDRIAPMWTCAQKRELRDVEKLAENSVRTFLGGAFEFSVSTNRLCLDANERFYDSAVDYSWSAVGRSKFMSGWDSIARKLDLFPNKFELDESQFDSSLFRAAMLGQRDIRWSQMRPEDRTPENWKRLCAIYDCIVNSFMVMEDGTLVQKTTGNPSGSSNTVVDNTMILFRLFAYAFIVLMKEQGLVPRYRYFVDNVVAALYGDDNTYSCSNEVVGWFSPANISRVWTEIGVTTKTPNWESGTLDTVSFLSNKFVYNSVYDMYFPCPDTDRILSSVFWGSDKDDVRYHFLRACALRMDAYWNKEVRDVLDGYLTYLKKYHIRDLVGSIAPGASSEPITMEQIFALWRSDLWIESLYSGLEGKTVSSEVSKLMALI